ncbi:cytochrome P450 [Streptomyces sp. BG9H]|uniref:Cytochrome P450 n=1 Tax=Streptomyces anatolicus TaxID=2675858 RepID=A0ABS6YGW0_9ACTN|nr:cytochrome P450 [Streptomyces anatolicus]MBW5420635.1 cytochrome P450 [Streptomyces anatolicus]
MTEIIDLGVYGSKFTVDPYPIYADLRERGPVHKVRTPEGQEVWLIVGHDEAREALADSRLSKKPLPLLLGQAESGAGAFSNMLQSDPPQHTRLRKLVAREFTGRRIEALRPGIERVTGKLLDDMLAAPDHRADLVAALAFPLPITVIFELLGVPTEDAATFHAWSTDLMTPPNPMAEAAAAQNVATYLVKLAEDKRVNPGDDLLSALVGMADGENDQLSDDELLGMCFLLLIAGHETTINLISNGVRALLDNPRQLAALREDLTLVDNAVEEMLRYDGAVETSTDRITAEPVEIGGVVIPRHEYVLVALNAANRAPERFEAPDEFDIRRDARGHIAFGHGIHYCMGAPLARMEAQIAIRALVERCPTLELDADPADLPWVSGMLIRGVRRLPVRWTPGH